VLPLVVALLLPSVLRAESGPFPYARIGVANGCFVESVAFGDELGTRFGADVWYRLLQWGAKEADEVVAGHAVVIFQHGARLWSYDINHGFTVLKVPAEQRDDVAAVAEQATAPYVGKITPRYPVYREDFPQVPEARSPAPFGQVEELDLSDAGLVAARLARKRPVALVEFTYPQDGATRRGAAVAFVYNGRLCVYSPPSGTVPFRVTALSVKNLRQLQELLRRIHPGASNLKAR
jgi:hypothetical protein